jgi:hypothetical protein
MALTLLTPDSPGEPVDPTGLAYVPDKFIHGEDGILYFLSVSHLSVFRWSIADGKYLDSIPLAQGPDYMAYSAVNDRLYLAYESGSITELELDPPFTETPFATSPQRPLGLSCAGEYVFLCDPSGSWESHYTYGPTGLLISAVDWNYPSREFVWSPVNRKMYFFRDGTSPNDLLWEDIDINGVIGTKKDSPYHSSTGITMPIRVAPDGSRVVLGSGRIYDAITLELLHELSNSVVDAAWWNGDLFTLRSVSNVIQLQRWTGPEYTSAGTIQWQNDAPLGIISVDDGILVMMYVNGVPTFQTVVQN